MWGVTATLLLTIALLFDKVKRMQTITLSSKNQVVIPRNVRLKLGLKGGDRLVIKKLTETEVVIKKEPSYADLAGTLPGGAIEPVARVRALRDEWRG